MNGRAPDAGGGVPSLFAGFTGLPSGARVIATRTTTTQVAHGNAGGASAAMHFDQLKSLALSMGMAASAGAARKNEAESKALAAAQRTAELEKALAEAQREVRHGCARRAAPRAQRLLSQVLKLRANETKLQEASQALAAKQSTIQAQFVALHSTLQKNHAKLKKGAPGQPPAQRRER